MKESDNDNVWADVGRLMRRAIETRKDKPKLAVLDYMFMQLEQAKNGNYEPNWRKVFKEAKRIWYENL